MKYSISDIVYVITPLTSSVSMGRIDDYKFGRFHVRPMFQMWNHSITIVDPTEILGMK